MHKFYITTPIYYVNDKPHIGHAYTTIAADVLARYWRKKIGDENVFFLTGTDEHGAKVAESAEKAGLDPQTFCDQNSQLFRSTFDTLNIKYDYFIRTTDKRHEQAVQKFMQVLYDKGDIYEGKYEGLYCVGCEKFLTEKELVDGKCPLHKEPPQLIKEKNYFFKLEKYLPTVQKLIESNELVVEPEERRSEVLGLFKQGLEDFSVSREKVEWGIPLPFDLAQKIYVWVDALQNYISGIGYGDHEEEFRKWWPADVHLMAKDILKFHAVYWPAILLAAGEAMPKKIFAHGFFSIDGQKMSKSIGNVIDPNVLVEKFGTDATRFLLLSQFPFGQDGDIKESKFVEQYNAFLANALGNLVGRVTTLIEQSGGKVQENEDGNVIKVQTELFLRSHGLYEKDFESLDFTGALSVIFTAIKNLNERLAIEKPWELDVNDEKRVRLLWGYAEGLLLIAEYLEPFMPNTAASIEKIFTAGTIKKAEPLFLRKK